MSGVSVAGGAAALIGLPDDADLIPIPREHLWRAVRGPIIHHDDLEVAVGLRQHAVYSLRQITGAVVAGDDDGHTRRAGPLVVRFP
jgi:hypothetical protein